MQASPRLVSLLFPCLISCLVAGAILAFPPGSLQAQSRSEKTVIPGDSITLFQFAISWLSEGYSAQELLEFLADGTVPVATPTPTPVGSVPPPTPTPTPADSGETFDLKDYFILASDSTWHYTGIQGASTDDDFKWTVEAETQDVGGGVQAVRIRTDTDEPSDALNGNVDFWRFDESNDLYYYGLYLANAFDVSVIARVPEQDIILEDPVRLGGDGLKVGDVVTDTGRGAITAVTFIGPAVLDATVEVTVQYTGFIPALQTPLGTFTDVLRMVVDLQATVGSGGSATEYEIRNNTFFLKKGVGMIAQDQQPDPDDAEIQGIDEGQVGGVTITPN